MKRSVVVVIVVLVLFGFFSAFLEGIGISTLIPLFSRFTEGTATDDPISQILGSTLALFNLGYAFKALLIIIISTFIFKSIFLFISSYISVKIAADYEKENNSFKVGAIQNGLFFRQGGTKNYEKRLENILLQRD